MKYTVKTEITTPGEHVLDVHLPFGVDDPEHLDKMVRAQARSAPEQLVELTPGEEVTEVWREGVRIYPRAVKNGRKKEAPEKFKPAKDKPLSVEEQIAAQAPKPVWPSEMETKDEEGAA